MTFRMNASVLCGQDPFKHLYRDHDVEGMSDGCAVPTCRGSRLATITVLVLRAHYTYHCPV